jgi:glyoxylase-like metal-dependent hydrolase (beta-lactamase superfamily II)
MRLLLPGIWTLTHGRLGRAYVVEDDRGLTMIDANQYGTLRSIEREIASIGRKLDDVHTMIATHHHPDHAGCAPEIRERTGAKLYAHSLDAPLIDGRTPRPPKPWWALLTFNAVRDMPPCPVDVEISGGQELPIAGGLTVRHSPGHTAGHISLYSASRRVLFAGDAIFNTFGLMPPFWLTTADMPEAKRSIHALASLDFDHLLPGHGNAVINHAGEKVRMWASKWVKKPA